MDDLIPSVTELEKIYNLKLVSDEMKNKADKYIKNTYSIYGTQEIAEEDEPFYCL